MLTSNIARRRERVRVCRVEVFFFLRARETIAFSTPRASRVARRAREGRARDSVRLIPRAWRRYNRLSRARRRSHREKFAKVSHEDDARDEHRGGAEQDGVSLANRGVGRVELALDEIDDVGDGHRDVRGAAMCGGARHWRTR